MNLRNDEVQESKTQLLKHQLKNNLLILEQFITKNLLHKNFDGLKKAVDFTKESIPLLHRQFPDVYSDTINEIFTRICKLEFALNYIDFDNFNSSCPLPFLEQSVFFLECIYHFLSPKCQEMQSGFLIHAYIILGETYYRDHNDYDKASEQFEKAHQINLINKDQINRTFILILYSRITVNFPLKNHKKIEEDCKTLMTIHQSKPLGDNIENFLKNSCMQLGNIYRKKTPPEYKKTLELINMACEFEKNPDAVYYRADLYFELTMYVNAKKDYKYTIDKITELKLLDNPLYKERFFDAKRKIEFIINK